jgi:ABC-type glycerol-3-phosphate transport system substrate-binding protein
MDLTGILELEVMEKQYENIIDAGKVNGKLYFLPISLEIEGLVTNTKLL